MKTTKKYDFKFIQEVGRPSLQGGTENLDDMTHHVIAMFDLSHLWQHKFANLLVGQTFFLEKAPHPTSVSCISKIGVQNVKEISRVEEKQHFLTAYLREVPDVLIRKLCIVAYLPP